MLPRAFGFSSAGTESKSDAPSSQVAEEGAEFGGQRCGFLHRGEMAARGHLGPAFDVVQVLGPCAGRTANFRGEQGGAGRNLAAPAWGGTGRVLLLLVVKAQRRMDALGCPVYGDAASHLVRGERR